MNSENLPVNQSVSDNHKIMSYSSPIPPSECFNDPRVERVIKELYDAVIEVVDFEVAVFH